MESVILDDTPLAAYLEGEGERGSESDSAHTDDEAGANTQSFAPSNAQQIKSRFQSMLHPKIQDLHAQQGTIATIHNALSSTVKSQLGRTENARFLERFRYIIIASQLLSEHVNISHYNSILGQTQQESKKDISAPQLTSSTLSGALATGALAFVVVWMLHWARGGRPHISKTRVLVVFTVSAVLATMCYAFVRRQWLQYLRHQATEVASILVSHSQSLDVSAVSALTFIQEVELVSRGYQISSPLPPISRLEERSQSRRCARIRRELKTVLVALTQGFNAAYTAIRRHVNTNDLEKYYEIYDISTPDIQLAEHGIIDVSMDEDSESLKSLKEMFHQARALRRIVLCCLLALPADGSKDDFQRWNVALEQLQALGSATGASAQKLHTILSEEQQFPSPQTPQFSHSPSRERVRAQLRKLNALSQGIRGLQAKMQLMREESDRTLQESEDVTELGSSLMTQYDSLGADLRALVNEWESGRTALALNINKHERRISSSSFTGLRSPAPSLGGMTAVEEGSPADALQLLNGDRSSRSSMDFSASEEEIFEAVALPRPRSMLSREERITKMKEERVKQAGRKELADTNTKMLRELESVINLKPRTRGSTRITSI